MTCLPDDIQQLYEVHNFRHAAEIMCASCPHELEELMMALRTFRLTTADILKPGGNESTIPQRVSDLLCPHGWLETRIKGDLVIRMTRHGETTQENELTIEDYLDGHKVDYVKNRVAFDLEWNSKDLDG
ncbi:BglII/BstYI family type II restriction endonuclease [Halothiobacillus sp. DCM-1]